MKPHFHPSSPHMKLSRHSGLLSAVMGQKEESKRPLLSGHQARAPTAPDSLPPPVNGLQPHDMPTTSLLHEDATPSAPMLSSLPQGYSEHVACYVPPAQQGEPQLMQIHRLGAQPEALACPRCGHQGLSDISKEVGMCTWLSSFMLCFVGCCWISWVPFCLEAAHDTVHRCPHCKVMLGRIRP